MERVESAVTRVVNVRTEKYDVYIGRPGMWGNPYAVTASRTREQAIRMYRVYLTQNVRLMRLVHTLHGKRLGCFCAPLACHGDVLKEFAERAWEESVRGG